MKGPSEVKKELVKDLASEIDSHNTIAVVDMHDLPAASLQKIRRKISNKVKIRMARRRIINHALEESKKESVKQLIEHANGMAALLFSNNNAFEVFKTLKENMSPAPAKAGQLAPYDIVIKAGPTSFPPGPMISEFSKFGIKTGIEEGKIAVKEEKVVAKEGDEINADLAGLLPKLDIYPMKIGINMICALENNDLFMRKVLDINEEEFISNIKNTYLDSLKLALGTGIINSETAPLMLQEAHNDAKKLALGAEIITEETREYLLKKVESQAHALKSKTDN